MNQTSISDCDEIIPNELAILSESALAVDWNRPEEDAAWEHLQTFLEIPNKD